MVKNALVSVYNKNGLEELGKFLVDKGVTIYSTGGTYRMLEGVVGTNNLIEVSSLTEHPEILDGRVKTLHPKIHGGILAKRDNKSHRQELEKLNIPEIDLVVCNLYPFKSVVMRDDVDEDTVLENIDIGGHTLIRSSAKNYKGVLTVTSPWDYKHLMDSWGKFSDEFRRNLAAKAYRHALDYDIAISQYFNKDDICRYYVKERNLKYGLNPQQKFAGIYREINTHENCVPFKVLNGNPGYINMLDAVFGWNLVVELYYTLNVPAAASYKHNSPAGVSVYQKPLTDKEMDIYMVPNNLRENIGHVATACVKAKNVDPMSSFGDFMAVYGVVDEHCAKILNLDFSDGIVAKGYTEGALEILRKKKRGNYVILVGREKVGPTWEIRDLHNLVLIQEENRGRTELKTLEGRGLDEEQMIDMVLTNTTLKFTQSNSVCSAKGGQIMGVGSGQQNRVDCVKITKRKTEKLYLRSHPKCVKFMGLFKDKVRRCVKVNALMDYINGNPVDDSLFTDAPEKLTEEEKKDYLATLTDVTLASDAFFPFRDSIDVASQFGIKYVIQPGGSINDKSVVDACQEYDMKMVMTGPEMRMFLH